jgi:hypothetical protein
MFTEFVNAHHDHETGRLRYNRGQRRRVERDAQKTHRRPIIVASYPGHLRAVHTKGATLFYKGGGWYPNPPGFYRNGGLRGVTYTNRNHRGSGYVMNALKKLTLKKEP